MGDRHPRRRTSVSDGLSPAKGRSLRRERRMFAIARRTSSLRPLLAAVILAAVAGCAEGTFDFLTAKKPPPEPPPRPSGNPGPILVDTIGTRTLLSAVEPIALRGFGVVVGLGEDGGADCPTAVREYLVDYFRREFAPDGGGGTRPRIAPERLIDSPDTAVVEVTGFVSGGAPRGQRFDLQVEALGTETRSLEGGLLLPCELKIFDVSAGGRGLLAGQTLAKAQGMVYAEASASPRGGAESRRGVIPGGGFTVSERPARLVLTDPSYALSRRIEARINERFGQSPKAAEAVSMSYLNLTTPPAYAEDPDRFLELAAHLLMENSPGYVERRLRELSEHLRTTEDKLASMSLIWEGIGTTVIPSIQPLYADRDAAVRYYAARAGLRLRDPTAIPILADIAASGDERFRVLAARELGDSGLSQAALRLAPLLGVEDPVVRIAAYEGLRRFRHPAIASRIYACPMDARQVNLTLDVIDCSGPGLIYVRRTQAPRLAVFGRDLAVRTPIFHAHPREWVMLNASDDADLITLYCRTRRSGVLSEQLFVQPRVVDLVHRMAALPVQDEIGQFQGLGLHFSLIVDTLEALCRDGTIPARILIEESGFEALPPPLDRPEADIELPPLVPREPQDE